MSGAPKKVGIVGASGYGGAELLRLCAGHPALALAVAQAGSNAGQSVGVHTPSLAAAYPNLVYGETDAGALDGLDVVFLALPHGQSQTLVPDLIGTVGVVVDLAADFRLVDPAAYPTWYGEVHRAPELLGTFTYGLPELHRAELVGSTRIAAPGCFPTAALLALAPLMEAGALARPGEGGAPPLVVDAASGVSGAGRAPKENLQFAAVDEDFLAYGLLDHRHTAEMEQGLDTTVLFTPHLAPMVRGILATCYARPADPRSFTTEDAMQVLRSRYADEPFVVVADASPSTKAASGSNTAHLSVRVDPRTGWVVVLSAIDNLIKGAAGQAVQCANLALGLPETTGLAMAGVYP
jgi:N-acetyl-gamma-glutamyl-phosphate reductase